MNDEVDNRPDFMKGIYIPPQPTIIEQIREATPDLGKIALLISKDAGITANIIRTVNSPAYNLPNSISSINQAVMLLGLDSVINIVNGLMIRVAFEKYCTDKLVEFWQLNEEIAICCAILAKRLDIADPEEAYMLGLFHNCGIPALTKKFADYYAVLQEAFTQNEQSVMGYLHSKYYTCHSTIGFYIAKNWKLPSNICTAIRDHRDRSRLEFRDECNDGILICLKIAEKICDEPSRLCGASASAHWDYVFDAILSELCMSNEDLEDLEHEVKDELMSY